MHRWIHAEKARYYQALLVKDLFDEWILIKAWGALESNRGGMRSTPVPSYEAGLERIGEIDKQRKRRGYRSLAAV
jgi:hypothetical protein